LQNISLIVGALIQVISMINFYLYAKASRQFAAFHLCLERTHRFLLANSLCENLKNQDHKDEARCALIDLIAQAPMLTEDVINAGGAGPRRRQRAARPKAAQD